MPQQLTASILHRKDLASGRKPPVPAHNVVHLAMSDMALKVMKERGITQTKLGELTGYSVSTINSAVRNKHMVSTRTWSDIFQALGIEIGFRVRPD